MAHISTKKKFTEGPLFLPMLKFAIPVIITNLLAILYNTADKIVVGQWSGDPNALGAISSSSFVFTLISNFLIGVGAGVGVLVSQAYGAGDEKRLRKAMQNSVILSVTLSAVMMVVAYLAVEPLLALLSTKETYFEGAALYLRVIYIGLFASSVYNIGAGILRAVGDSKTPLYIGLISGAINVVLNIIFVACFGMSVEGVALATVISQYFSAVTVVVILLKRKGEPYRLTYENFRYDRDTMLEMLRLGLPTGLQSASFSATSLITSWAVNSFPDAYVTARGIGLDIDHIASAFTSGFFTSTMTATAQNYGKGEYKRVRRVLLFGLIQSLTVCLIASQLLLVFRSEVASWFVAQDHPEFDEIIAAASEWSAVMLGLYFTQGLLQALTGAVRGMGYSISSLVCNLIGVCAVRIIWVFVIFPLEPFNTFSGLALLYPVSWLATGILLIFVLVRAFIKLSKEERKSMGQTAGQDNPGTI